MLSVEDLKQIVTPPVALVVQSDAARRAPSELSQLGRDAARAALASLGVDAGDLAAGPHGPVWPEGIVGSIAHTDGTAVSIAARTYDRAALGIDLEHSDRAITSRVLKKISTEQERAWLSTAAAEMPLVLFCAKEATYKALSRFERHPVSFGDVSFEQRAPALLVGTLVSSATPFDGFSEVTARTLLTGGYVLAVVEVEASLLPSSRVGMERVAPDSR